MQTDGHPAEPTGERLSLPLFPLGSVLFPGGLLPLRIFEVRYLDMITRCHQAGTPFGVVCLTQGSEVQRPAIDAAAPGAGNAMYADEEFFDIGTLARIDTLERPQPGLLVIRCTGTQRFRLMHRERLKHGLWTGVAERIADDLPTPVPPDLQPVRDALVQLHERMVRQGVPEEARPIQTPLQWDDCGWLANRWSELLPLNSALKQRLMSLDSPLLRLELVADVLGPLEAS
jgi:uncharacterized protein